MEVDERERRRFGRRDLEAADAVASVLMLRLEQKIPAVAVEISPGGVRLECEPLQLSIADGDTVLVRLGSSSVSAVVTLPGQIAWTRPADGRQRCELGVSFEGSRHEIETMLAPFLRVVEQRRNPGA